MTEKLTVKELWGLILTPNNVYVISNLISIDTSAATQLPVSFLSQISIPKDQLDKFVWLVSGVQLINGVLDEPEWEGDNGIRPAMIIWAYKA